MASTLPCDSCTWTAGDFSAAVQAQNPTFSNEILREIGVKSPWPSVLDGGEIANNAGEYVLNIAQGLAAPNVSLSAPVFTPSSQMCQATGNVMEPGALNYSVRPETLVGKTVPFCWDTERITVMNALESTINSLKTTISMINAADIANQMLVHSGLKFTVNADAGGVEEMASGGEGLVDQFFPDIGLPNAAPTFTYLTAVDTYCRENQRCVPWNSGQGEYAIFLSGKQLQDQMFFQDDLKQYIIGKNIQGGYLEFSKASQSYAFTNIMAKGLMFGVIQQPQRFRVMTDQDGVGTPMPTLIEPMTKVAADTGFRLIPNPEWLNPATAPYEIAYLVYPNSFKRLAPRPYAGEGAVKFPPQMFFGEIRWFIPQDVANLFQKYGLFGYQIMRAFQPQRPSNVVPIAFKRCPSNLGLTACAATPSF